MGTMSDLERGKVLIRMLGNEGMASSPKNVGILAMEFYFPRTCVQQVMILSFCFSCLIFLLFSFGLLNQFLFLRC